MRWVSVLRGLVVVAVLGWAVPASAAVLPGAGGGTRTISLAASGQYGRLTPDHTVTLWALPPTTGNHPSLPYPFHPRDAAQFQKAKQQADSGVSVPRAGLRVATIKSPPVTTAQTQQITTSFPLTSYAQQVGWFGTDQMLAPPDTQLAAGPTSLLETINSSGSVWSKTGTLIKDFDLNAFFPVPSGYSFTDPRVVYDAASQRWFVSGLAFNSANDSQVYVMVSQSSDPTGSWTPYTIESNTNGTIYDQPKLGISDDKVVVSWNDYGGSNLAFTGSEIWVLQKSDMLSQANTVAEVSFRGMKNRFDIVPAISLSTTTTEYLTYNNADPNLNQNTPQPTVGVIALTGTPAQNNVKVTETDLPISATALPPTAVQPGANSPNIATNDDRFVSTVWQNGILWTGGNDQCTPSGDTTNRSCLRLIQINTAGASPIVTQDFDVGASGAYLYFPAITLDGAGNAFVSFTESSSTMYASAMTAAQPVAGPSGSLGAIQMIHAGQGVFNWCGQPCANPEYNRWGDYSGAAPDPVDPTQVWVTAEYAASSSQVLDWGTGTAEVTLGSSTTLTSTSTATSTATATDTSTVTPTVTASFTPTDTSTPTGSATTTLTPSATATVDTPTPSVTATVSVTSTSTASDTATPTATNSPTVTVPVVPSPQGALVPRIFLPIVQKS